MSLIGKTLTVLNRTPVPYAPRGLSLPWRKQDGAEGQMRAYGSVGTLFNIVSTTSQATAEVEWKLYRKSTTGDPNDRTEVTSHPALDLWNTPNKYMTRQELVEAVQQHIDLTGEGWVVVGRNPIARSIPLELWPVRPDQMAPQPSATDFIVGYWFTGPDGTPMPLPVDDVLFLRMPNPLDPYRGLGPVQSVLIDLDSSHYAATWNRNFFLNSAQPGGIIEVDKRLSDDEFNELTTRWREQHQGVANAHRVAVIEQGKWVPNNYTMRDMQFVELRNVAKEKIREAFGFPKFAGGEVDDVNRATAEASAAWFARRLTVPRLKRWKGMLNNDFLPLFGTSGKGLEFDYVSPVMEDREANNAERDSITTALKTLTDASVEIDRNVLSWLGLPPTWKIAEPASAPIQATATVDGQIEEGAPRNAGGSFLQIVGRFRRRSELVDRTYKRDKEGKFSSGGGATGQAALDAVPGGTRSLDFSDDERRALAEYRSPEHFLTINGSLRGEILHAGTPATAATQQQIAALDSIMSRSRTTADVEVWRGLQGGADRVFGDRMSGDMTGLEWREQGFASTSVRMTAAREFTQDRQAVLMRISVPKATGAAKFAYEERAGEGEVLLERGLRMRVTADRGKDPDWGYRLLDVEVVPE